MRRTIPSTAALVAFDAAARHQSFTLAADELALTQSAVGRQVANLEEFLGVKLFRRTRHGIALTPAGQAYAQTVAERLGQVERDALALMASGGSGSTIQLGVVPTFATHWLIPRLGDFTRAHPGVSVHLHVQTRPFLFSDTRLDAAVHAGRGGWPGTHGDLLMPEALRVVCAPAVLGRRKTLSPAQVASQPLIHMTTRPYAWRDWFAAHGMRVPGDMEGPRVELFSMAVKAAGHGLGVALVPEFLANDLEGQGAVVATAGPPVDSGLGYYLICPEGAARHGALWDLRCWLLQQAAATPAS